MEEVEVYVLIGRREGVPGGGRMKNQEVTEGVAKGGGGVWGWQGRGEGGEGWGESKREDR